MKQKNGFVIRYQKIEGREIPVVSTQLSRRDKWQNVKVRLGIKRMKYAIEPGLYAVGDPDQNSLVMVTANFKLTFDLLRKELSGINAWLLVLNTRGINVWCAAGKGTFSTAEIVRQIISTQLDRIVSQRTLLVPQLGATGVAAYRVRQLTGFTVLYGPIRAADIPAFIQAGLMATPEMRQVTFTMIDRLKLIPLEMVQAIPKLLLVMGLFFILAGLNRHGYSLGSILDHGLEAAINLSAAFIGGIILGPWLLPWIPGRSFSFKGFITGLMMFILSFSLQFVGPGVILIMAWLLLIPAFSSFATMNFTGASTYTSLSGVKKEMRTAIPLQIAAATVGFMLWLIARFV